MLATSQAGTPAWPTSVIARAAAILAATVNPFRDASAGSADWRGSSSSSEAVDVTEKRPTSITTTGCCGLPARATGIQSRWRAASLAQASVSASMRSP